ncbi:ABC transporter permease subunit [Halobacterium litoreum]|uniref:ABC transporter permease subunit n=1 Tax=Halobacterium litoreum TaxID=2039234 RepID=A0ABD5NE79_9EURY|nr:ABC transporter permease subunit [Halobacterium litoreum]UHH13440.1 ABC transporter permease subunit [Halobacterium litoreum]
MGRRERVLVVVERELRTVARNRTLVLVAAAFAAVIVGLGGAAMGSPGGYVSLTFDLLLPVEVLVPTVAFAFVYQSVRGDADRGELDVIRTYPVTRAEYVLGVFLGRAAAVLAVVLVALGAAGVASSLGATEPASYFATHAAGDTPVVFVRFAVFVAAYALVAVALALAVSAATRSQREALGASVGVLVAVAVGLDLALVALASGGLVDPGSIAPLAGLSPASAFRGLVFELAVGPALAETPTVATASPVASALGLLAWVAASLGAAAVAVWPDTAT